MVYNWYNIYIMIGFECDEKKHRIDFVAAQRLWEDPDLLELPARTQDEERFLVIGKIEEKHWSGVITYESI